MSLRPDFRPSKAHLSNEEILSTGTLCGGAITNIARELLELRERVYGRPVADITQKAGKP